MAQLTPQNNQSIPNGSEALLGLLPKMLTQKTVRQFIKYVITGLVSLTVEISLLYFLTEVVNFWYIYANSLALLIVFVINFSLNRFWAFRSQQPFMKQFITSGILFVFNLLVGNVIMFFFTETIHLYYMFSKVIATGLAVTWDFFLYKFYIYK